MLQINFKSNIFFCLLVLFLPLLIPTRVKANFNNAIYFEGTGSNQLDRVLIPINSNSISKKADIGGSDFTIEWWMKATLQDNNTPTCSSGNDNWITGNVIVDRDIYGGGDFGDYGVSIKGGKIAFGIHNGTSGSGICSSASVTDGNWHHIAITRQFSSGKVVLFIDGKVDVTSNMPIGNISYNDSRTSSYQFDPYLVLGAEKHDEGTSYPSYKGWMDEFRISNIIRYTATVNTPSQPFTPDNNTMLLYKFDQTGGLTTADSSGNSITGTVKQGVSFGLANINTTSENNPNSNDLNNDFKVDILDVLELIKKIFNDSYIFVNPNADSDINKDNKINLIDVIFLIQIIFDIINPTPTTPPTPTVTPTPIPTPTGSTTNIEWNQHGYNAQRTAWNPQNISNNWTYVWQRGDVDMRSVYQVYPVVGGNRVYIAAANNTLYALNITNGQNLWTKAISGSLNSSPSYDSLTDTVYITGGQTLYKVNAQNGAIVGQYNSGANLDTSPLIVNDFIYITSNNGKLHKVNKNTMQNVWIYTPNPSVQNQVTMPSYSESRKIIIYATDPDLYVHAINETDGSLKWKFKPTVNTYNCGQMGEGSSCHEFKNNWPVIADNAGVVLIRMRLGYDAMYFATPMPNTNTAIRQLLESNPQHQSLFALNLDTGTKKFIPAIKYGAFGNGTIHIGPQPAIRTLDNGKQVAYIIYANGQTCAGGWCDYREDATMGEMVLDDNTVSGYKAGDSRFVKFIDIQTDEQGMISGSGNTVFHSHWLAVLEGLQITNRSDSLGATFTNPITGNYTPHVVDRQCGNCNTTTHYCTNLCGENGGRGYPDGFYIGTSGWTLNPYVLVSNGYIIVKNINSDIFVLKANSASALNTDSKVAGASISNVTNTQDKNLYTIRSIDAEKYIDKYVLSSCKIKYIHQTSKFLYLGCGEPHDKNLQLLIPIKNLKKFNFDVIEKYKLDSTINFSGKVNWYQGDPVIYINEVSQIK